LNDGFWRKPAGVLWTSSLTDEDDCDWLRWCRGEMPEWAADCTAAIFEVRESTRLVRIDHSRVYYRLCGSCPRTDLPDFVQEMGERYLDWQEVARYWDAVHLVDDIGRGCWHDTGRGYAPELYGWDCESTAWFRPAESLLLREVVPVKEGRLVR
jgi:hypothetical protein